MNETSHDISQELSGLGEALADLGATLSNASLRLLQEGLLPTESLAEQILEARSELRMIRSRICGLARERGIAVPPLAAIDNIKAIDALYQQVQGVERQRAAKAQAKRSKDSIIDRIINLRHDRLTDYAPLAACQALAKTVSRPVDAAETNPVADAELEAFVDLLALIEIAPDASAEARESLAKRLEKTFGRSLAMAAASGAIVPNAVNREGESALPSRSTTGQRKVFAVRELGIGLADSTFAASTADPVSAGASWFSGLGVIPRMVLDESFRPILKDTSVFQLEPHRQRVVTEVSASAFTPLDEFEQEAVTGSTAVEDSHGESPLDSLKVQSPAVREKDKDREKETRHRTVRSDAGGRGGAGGSVGDFLVFRTDPFSTNRSRKLGNAVRRRVSPIFEQLETLRLMACNAISGFVYLDNNNDGLYDQGDSPISNNTVQLYNSQNQLVGTTTSDSTGAYTFNSDATINTATQTVVQSATVTGTTNYIKPITLPKFDTSLGTLTGVVVEFTGAIDSHIQTENTSVSSGDTATASQSGDITLMGTGLSFDVPLSHDPLTATLSTFDGTEDFGGTSGHDFGDVNASGNATKTLTTAAGDDLSAFSGSGNYQGFVDAQALAKVTGGGNLDSLSVTSATATLKLTYQYTPMNCLSPGQYTIVQPVEPPGTLNGRESSGGVVLPFNPVLPNKIAVTLGDTNSINNNFGQILPGGLGGFVYVDANKNGLKDPGETPLPNVPINLTGTNDLGQAVTLSTTTDGNGQYSFTGLRPGTYQTAEPQQPAGYLDGQETRGNVTPIPNTVGTDVIPNIPVTVGNFTPNNNFGEYTPGTPGGTEPVTTIAEVEREGIHHQLSTLIIHYNNGVDPASATNVNYYHLARIYRNGMVGRQIPIRSAVYNPADNTVTLTPVHRINVHDRYLLTITSGGVLSNTNPKQPIDGDNNGIPGGDYVTTVTRANYPHPLVGPGVIHQSLPTRAERIAARSANPGLARQHLVHAHVLGRGLSI